MFWGLIMEPKRRYTQTVKRPFHVSMAALDIFSSNNEPCQVMLNFEERNYLLCTLQKGKDVQCVLDLNFEAGNKVIFATNGDSNVHLTGYLVEDLDDYLEEQEEEEEEVDAGLIIGSKKRKTKVENQPPKKKSRTEQLLDEADNYDSNDDESFSLSKLGEDDESEESASSDDDEDDELAAEDEEDDDDDDEENEESLDEDDEELSSLSDAEENEVLNSKLNGAASKRKQREVQKKAKLVKQEAQSPNVTNKSARGEKTPSKQEKSPKADNILKTNKTPKGEKTPKVIKDDGKQKNGSAVKTPKEQQAGSPQKRTLEGGVIIQDLVVGNGQVVKPGKLAMVYYEGRLKQNNKVFDKLRQGPGFKFRLGKQEVIKGWDVGVVGMKVGGKRRITCPPNMGYGLKGSPPQIPPNSTLLFEVELKNIQ